MNNLTILLVDDDEDDREFFKIALEGAALTADCLTAESDCTAIQFLNEQQNHPAFIFLDLNMPLMSEKNAFPTSVS